MIVWFCQLGQASHNLGRIARQNPVWAVQSLIFAPSASPNTCSVSWC